MFQIDLSFLKGSLLDEENLKQAELQYDCKYKSKILEDILPVEPQISGCLTCGIDGHQKFPIDHRNILEAECRGLLGCHYCEVKEDIKSEIFPEDLVIINCENNNEISKIVEVGEIVRLKRQTFGFYGEELPAVIRKANEQDLEQYRKNLKDEAEAIVIFKEKVLKFKLSMKLVNIHYQFDRKKLFFFYTADGRVDFRELAKELASIYRTRIELRQIGVRDEAKQIGGLGTCGREYCCTSFLSNFKRITTQLANDQNLASNMAKLSGPCGKLKCCLSFEVDCNKNCQKEITAVEDGS